MRLRIKFGSVRLSYTRCWMLVTDLARGFRAHFLSWHGMVWCREENAPQPGGSAFHPYWWAIALLTPRMGGSKGDGLQSRKSKLSSQLRSRPTVSPKPSPSAKPSTTVMISPPMRTLAWKCARLRCANCSGSSLSCASVDRSVDLRPSISLFAACCSIVVLVVGCM